MSGANSRCIFCSKYLVKGTNPRQAPCGDRLCGACLSLRGLAEVVCPVCGERIKLSECFRDKAIEQELANFSVKCSSKGCPWEGLCEHLEAHEASCKFAIVKCPNSGCPVTVQREQLETHRTQCFQEPVTCHLCHTALPRGRIQEHVREDCQAVELECRNKCGERVARCKMDKHIQTECSQRTFMCTFDNCSYQGTGKELQEHDSQSVAFHLRCLHRTVEDLRSTSSLLARNTPSNTVAERITAERERAQSQLVADLVTKIQALTDNINQLEPVVIALQEASNDMGLTIQTLQATTYDGKFVWKIPEVMRRRREARTGKTVSLYSAPFYTSRHGYKACLRLYMNGDGAGKGTHLSFFITLMRGEYDALLPWPFRQAVTLTLVDQNKQRDIVQSFRPEPTSSSFQRPRNEMNIASGCPMFASVSVLDNSSYVKDDTMFLKCKIDLVGLEGLY